MTDDPDGSLQAEAERAESESEIACIEWATKEIKRLREKVDSLHEELELRLAQIDGMKVRIHDAEKASGDARAFIAAMCYENGGHVSVSDAARIAVPSQTVLKVWQSAMDGKTHVRLVS